jgi:hypothetical protein
MHKNAKLVDLVVDRFVNLDFYYKKLETMPNGCIEWRGPKNNAGYGFIGFKTIDEDGLPKQHSTRMMTVHRLAFMIANKSLPTKRNVNHTCHNKLCCCPEHLAEGTQQDKIKSMKRDGIHSGGSIKGVKRGSYNHKQMREYKYSEEDIQWIRTADPDLIASRYNLSRAEAQRKQGGFRAGYKWLACPPYEKKKPGRKPKTDK